MRSGLRYAAAWLLATSLAVCVSWIGVRGAVRSAVFGDGPAPPPVSSGTAHPSTPVGRPIASSTAQPTTRPTAHPTKTSTTNPGSPPPRPRRTPDPTPSEPTGTRRTVRVAHGTAVVRLTSQNARVLTATPAPGYTRKIWYDDGWLRVDFARGQHGSAVFVTWNDHPPLVQTYEY